MDQQQIIPTNKDNENFWNTMVDFYAKHDSSAQSFYFSLIHMLKIPQAKNILEVACGRSTLLPLAIQLKQQSTHYLATDLSKPMLAKGDQFLREHFAKYDSKLTYEEWLQKHNVTIRAANGEEPFNANPKFDRIICNLVLMIVEDPLKMMQNLSNEAQVGCLLAVSVWANPQLNKFDSFFNDAVKQLGFTVKPTRSTFHLHKKVGELAEKTGWEVVLNWQHNSVFDFTNLEEISEYAPMGVAELEGLNQEEKKAVEKRYIEKMKEHFDGKKALIFPAELYILRKI